MDENEINESEAIVVKPTGVPESIAVIMCILILLGSGSAIYFARQQTTISAGCEANSAAMVAGASAQKAQIDYQTACVKRDSDLRLEVIKQCVAKGNIPVLMGGNVDCKASPK